jgi:hypothetical protein
MTGDPRPYVFPFGVATAMARQFLSRTRVTFQADLSRKTHRRSMIRFCHS